MFRSVDDIGERSRHSGASAVCWPCHFEPPLLQSEGALEVELVLTRLGYDAELLERDEVDEKQLVGLRGVIKISHIAFNGSSLLRFDGFAQRGASNKALPSVEDS